MSNTINDVDITTDAKSAEVALGFTADQLGIAGNQYDYGFSFFRKTMKDDSAAGNFTDSIFQISKQADIPITDLLQSLKNKDEIEMTSIVSFYLNGIRSASTLLGINNVVRPNFYAARNVKG